MKLFTRALTLSLTLLVIGCREDSSSQLNSHTAISDEEFKQRSLEMISAVECVEKVSLDGETLQITVSEKGMGPLGSAKDCAELLTFVPPFVQIDSYEGTQVVASFTNFSAKENAMRFLAKDQCVVDTESVDGGFIVEFVREGNEINYYCAPRPAHLARVASVEKITNYKFKISSTFNQITCHHKGAGLTVGFFQDLEANKDRSSNLNLYTHAVATRKIAGHEDSFYMGHCTTAIARGTDGPDNVNTVVHSSCVSADNSIAASVQTRFGTLDLSGWLATIGGTEEAFDSCSHNWMDRGR